MEDDALMSRGEVGIDAGFVPFVIFIEDREAFRPDAELPIKDLPVPAPKSMGFPENLIIK